MSNRQVTPHNVESHPLDLIGEIAEALSESDLPFRVDLVDLAAVEPPFRARVSRDAVPLAFRMDDRPAGVAP